MKQFLVAALLPILLIAAGSTFAYQKAKVDNATFAEDMARAQASVSQAQAQAVEAQARAIESQAEINKLLILAQAERAKAEAFQAQVGGVALVIMALIAIVLAVYIVQALRVWLKKQKPAARPAGGQS